MPVPVSTPSLEEAANAAESSLQDQTNNPAGAEVNTGEEAQTPNESPEAKGEESEQFTTVKLDDLPEELKGTYKSLQADYTRKRQKEAAEMKKMRDQIASFDNGQKQISVRQMPQAPASNPIQAAVQQEFAIERARQEYQKEVDYVTNAQQEFVALDERLNSELPNYDQQMAHAIEHELAVKRGEYEQEHGTVKGFDFIGLSKQLVKNWDSYLDKQYKDYISRQNVLAKKNVEKSRLQNPDHTSAPGMKAGKMTIEEAVDEAWNQMGQ